MSEEVPPWLLEMRAITGLSEKPGEADEAKILAMADYIAQKYPEMKSYCAGYKHDATPWCGLCAAYTLARSNIRPPFGKTDTERFLWARSFDDQPFATILKEPRLGCIVVMTREGGGHVTLYESTEGSNYKCRGGNQSDKVGVNSYSKSTVIALVWPKDVLPDTPGVIEPPTERRTLNKGHTGPDVAALQKVLGIPADGDFGDLTETQVEAFQAASELEVDGVVGPLTWEQVDLLAERKAKGENGLSPALEGAILGVVGDSPLLTYRWKDRGVAPRGYLEGMALVFGFAVQEFLANNMIMMELAKATDGKTETDALAWYAKEFAEAEMVNDEDGLDTLRHLFVMLIGLGMRESSGKYYCGRDLTASNTSPTTAEAGAWQTSWNIESCSPLMQDLYDIYWDDPNGWLDIFSENLTPTAKDLQHFGSGEGATYQFLAKYAPAFAAYTTALGLRLRRKHWGPINRKEVEIVPDCDDLLLQIQSLAVESEPVDPEPGPDVPTVSITTTGEVIILVNGEVWNGPGA